MNFRIPPPSGSTSAHQERFAERREPPTRAYGARSNHQGAAVLEQRCEVSARDGHDSAGYDAQWLADGMLFEQWLAPLGSNGSSQGRDGVGQQARAGVDVLGSSQASACDQLVDEVAMRLHGADKALQATLLMPNLGRIAINARHRPPQGWNVDLDCQEERAAEHLRTHRRRCQDDLGRALRDPVGLRISHQGRA